MKEFIEQRGTIDLKRITMQFVEESNGFFGILWNVLWLDFMNFMNSFFN